MRMACCQQSQSITSLRSHTFNPLINHSKPDKPYISEHSSMQVLTHHQLQILYQQRANCPLRQAVRPGRAFRREQLTGRRRPAPVASIAGPSFESIDSDDFLSPVATLVSLVWFCSCGLPCTETCNRAFHVGQLKR
jgi:hypothetical protein